MFSESLSPHPNICLHIKIFPGLLSNPVFPGFRCSVPDEDILFSKDPKLATRQVAIMYFITVKKAGAFKFFPDISNFYHK